ncbi:hypothetical protein [Chlorobaculum sp. 24CR]|jgi:hypothetical protein|nr:hypothetical protein [Chlorobaculum sp. 24CR]
MYGIFQLLRFSIRRGFEQWPERLWRGGGRRALVQLLADCHGLLAQSGWG